VTGETIQKSIRHESDERVFVRGWGNTKRQDDGLGPCLADRLRALDIPGVTVESAFQLQAKHAEQIGRADLVVFVDAAATGPSPFLAKPIGPLGCPEPSTHALEPGTVLALTNELHGTCPRAILLGVRGYSFGGSGEKLSERAERNLRAAGAWLAAALAPPTRNLVVS